MDALIMSCGMGGGHNAAAYALQEELERRGHRVTRFNPYTLKSDRLARGIDNAYIRMAQRTPRLFGGVYRLARAYERLPMRSPVYALNGLMARRMGDFLTAHPVDVILMPHFFPAHMLMHLRRRGVRVPPTVLIATDYTCVPLEAEVDCDAYVIPAADLTEEFIARGLPPERLHPLGIPVRRSFSEPADKAALRRDLGLDPDGMHILVAGGSIGAGSMEKAVAVMMAHLPADAPVQCTVLCGNNDALLCRMQERHAGDARLRILASTSEMPAYLRASDLFISKPGGLSSTEAAAARVPLVHMTPIPGCETANMAYFSQRGMSIAVQDVAQELPAALSLLTDAAARARMRACQQHINARAASDIADLAEQLARGGA